MNNFTLTEMTTTNSVADMIANSTTRPGSEDVDISTFYVIERYFWIIFSPIFLLIGLIGNLLNVFVLSRLKFHKNSTYVLLFILAFTDMTVLITGLMRYWILYLSDLEVDIRVVSEFSCKFSFFLIYFSMQFSSWILVLVTIIRFMKTFVPLKRTTHKDITVRRTLLAVLVTGLILAGINLHFFWTNGITADKDCSSLTPEYFYFDEHVFVYVDLVFLSVLPAGIMIVLNILICMELKKLTTTRRRMSTSSGALNPQKKQKSTKRVTLMLVVTTSYFIIATIPICIYFIVDTYVRPGATALTESRLDLAWTFTYLFQFSHFALNFYLYTATNERFRKELISLKNNVYQRISTSSASQSNRAPREYSSESKKVSVTASS